MRPDVRFALCSTLLLLAGLSGALAQRKPIYTDATNYSYGGPCAYPSDAWVFNSSTGNCYRCVSSVWVSCSFPAAPVSSGPSNSVQIGNGAGAFAGEAAFSRDPALDIFTLQGLQLWDTNEDGTSRLAVCGDANNDGTFNAADCTTCRTSYQTALCVASELGVDLDGNGTSAGADWDADGTPDERGVVVTGPLAADRLLARDLGGATTLSGNGGTYQPLTAQVSTWAEQMLHASLYSRDPDLYLRPKVWDAFRLLADGQKWTRNTTTGVTASCATVAQCASGSCTSDTNFICANTNDVNSDGTNDFPVGTQLFFGNYSQLSALTTLMPRTFTVDESVVGDGSFCQVSQWRLRVRPGYDPDADYTPNVNGAALCPLWGDAAHLLQDAGYLVYGRQLGRASGLVGSHNGPNLVRNGEMEYDTTLKGWTVAGATIGSAAVALTPTTGEGQCWQGNGTADCVQLTTAAGSITSDWITVQPGERYVVSAVMASGDNSASILAVTDTNNDGTVEATTIVALDGTNNFRVLHSSGIPAQIWGTYEVPSDVDRVQLRIDDATASNNTTVDQIYFARLGYLLTDDAKTAVTSRTNYLINDPGDGCILLAGDSWHATSPTDRCTYAREGLSQMLAARYAHKTAAQWQSQIRCSGVSGQKASDVLTNWYDQVQKYACTYTVFSIGQSDICPSVSGGVCVGVVTAAQYAANVREIAVRARQIPTIAIFVTAPPGIRDTNADNDNNDATTEVGSGSQYDTAQQFRDVLLNMVLGAGGP